MSADPTTVSSPIVFEHSFAHAVPGGFVPVTPTPVPAPEFVQLNDVLAAELGLDPTRLSGPEGLAWFAGNAVPPGAQPIALAYAGHQFGQFVPQLGDGRALLLGERIDVYGRRRDIALKGSGPTPFSRGGDGKAALGPVLREYLLGEAMHALGIPSTRALAAVRSGEPVFRDGPLPGAVLTRVAASHLRVGTFEFFAVRNDLDSLRRLLDYTLARHYPEQHEADNKALALIAAVMRAQARLVARWMAVGFIHGVMNTDNMALSGETIDYGPCAFMDSYHPDTVYSSIDRRGRYAYARQPAIAGWNLARFAETLLPLIDPDPARAIERATETLHGFERDYQSAWNALLSAKMGLSSAEPDDPALFARWLQLIEDQQADWTLAWRALAQVLRGNPEVMLARFADTQPVQSWLADWQARLAREPIDPLARAAAMDAVNPWLIARNHRVEAALAAAVTDGDLGPFADLLAALRSPFCVDPTHAAYADPPPSGFSEGYRTFCGT